MTRSALLLTLLTAIACRDPVSSSPIVSTPSALFAVSAPEIDNVRIPYPATTIVGTCTGEAISLSGEIHITTKIWRTGDSFRIQGHINLNVAGIGLSSGRTYRFLQVTNNDQEFELGSPDGTARQTFHVYVISQGSASNFYVTMNGEFRFSASGVEFIPRKAETICQ